MFLNLLKRAVKAALWDAVEEWALECGLPRTAVEDMRAQRLTIIEQTEATVDARAALALGVQDEDEDHPAPPTLSASRVTANDAGDQCPPPGDEVALLNWIHRQRERQTGWADIAKSATVAGHDVGEDALRMRFRRWRDKNDLPNGEPPPAA